MSFVGEVDKEVTFQTAGAKHRVQFAKIPGSVHWEYRHQYITHDSDEWETIASGECRGEPDFGAETGGTNE